MHRLYTLKKRVAYVILHSVWTEQDLCKVNSMYKGQLDDEKAAIY